LDRAKSSAFRHFMQWFNGETDEDHAAAIFFNVQAVEYIKGRMNGDWYMGKARSIVVLSDTQMPYEDKRAVKAVIKFIKDYQPDQVIHIGDVVDYLQQSRWTKGTRAESEGSVFKDSVYTIRNLIQPLREVYG